MSYDYRWSLMSFSERSSRCSNELNKLLFSLMEEKKSTLCLAVDLTKSKEILEIADKFGPHIIAIKLHVDIIDDFSFDRFVEPLLKFKKQHRFLIFEDRKFADIGSTVLKQYVGGFYKIQDWADLVTSHIVSGPSCIESLRKGVAGSLPRGVLLISQMSSAGNLLNQSYIESARSIARSYPDFVSGFISQSRVFDSPSFVQFTPGVNIGVTGDGMGQQYVSPEEAVLKRGADVIIVGRGILQSDDPLSNLLLFKEKAFNSYLERLKEPKFGKLSISGRCLKFS